jgi:chromosome segregation ATPase
MLSKTTLDGWMGCCYDAGVSDTVDLTLLSGTMLEIARDIRLMRLQVDSLASRLSAQDGRLGGIEGRLGALEASFHDLVGETSRGFSQVQQQITRLERRIDALDSGLAALKVNMNENTTRIIAAIEAGRAP